VSYDARSLATLLPAILRIRDAELAAGTEGLLTPAEQTELQGLEASVGSLDLAHQERLQVLRDRRLRGPLAALLAVIAEQVAVLESDLEQLYDDQFIETCAEWVVPYIGDLIGYRSLHEIPGGAVSSRAEVAHTIAFRRRKGTVVMLEQLARDVTGWDATAVEFFERLAATQYMNHRRLHITAPDLRRSESLELVGSAFDRIPRSVEVRRIASGRGRHNIPNVGIYLWRLKAYTLRQSPAVQVSGRRYRFSPLGHDIALIGYRPPQGDVFTQLSEPIDVPSPISRREFARSLSDDDPSRRRLYYGDRGSILVTVNDVPVGSSSISVCNLEDDGAGWAQDADPTRCIIDPRHGRLLLPLSEAPDSRVEVSFRYAFASEMGGGEYPRKQTFDPGPPPVKVPDHKSTIGEALNALQGSGIVEITNSGRYVEHPHVTVATDASIEIRAADGCRPTLVLDGEMSVTGGADSEVRLNGLLIAGHRLRVPQNGANQLARLFLRHCTLVPGWSLNPDGTPQHPDQASVIVDLPDVRVTLERCIVGAVLAVPESRFWITDCLVDATDRTAVAFAAPDGLGPGGQLEVVGSTVIGKVRTELLHLASDTIFFAERATGDPWPAPVLATRRQQGCVRFSFVPLGSLVPRRYQCQPADAAMHIAPCFVSLRYGSAAYGQLSLSTPAAILRGASDENEMGAFHHVHAAQREINIRVRLEEYLRVGVEAGVIYAT
jgi:hypothetical protein